MLKIGSPPFFNAFNIRTKNYKYSTPKILQEGIQIKINSYIYIRYIIHFSICLL